MLDGTLRENLSTQKAWQSAIEDLSSRVFGRRDAFALSKTEIARLEYEARAEKSTQEITDRNHFQEEERAIALGISVAGTGRRIYRHGSKPHGDKIEEERKKDADAAIVFLTGSALIDTIKHVGEYISELSHSLRHTFTPTAKQTNNVCTSADNQFVFDDVPLAVTFATQAQIEKEASILKTEYDKLEAMNDNVDTLEPGVRARQALKLFTLSDEFDMRRHPETKAWVPSEIRVLELERIHNPHGTAECKGLVCVFRPATLGQDSRGIKRQVGDVLDQNPTETVTSGQHLSADVKSGQAPAPSP